MADVTVRINEANMAWFLTSPAGPIVRKVATHTRRGENAVKAAAPVKTGAGRAGIRSDVIVRGQSVVGRIFMPKHLWYQDQGTGIYAGNGPIRPKRGKYLVWEEKNSRRGGRRRTGRGRNLVFAKETRGVKPRNFVLPAVRSAVPWPVRGRR